MTSPFGQTTPPSRVFFGGPDLPPRALRDLLYSHISSVPAGGEIFWATYYFRDEALAGALVQARKRGVSVRLTLEAHPRTPRVNRPVMEMLQRAGNLGGHVRPLKHIWPDNLAPRRPRLHIKLYYFSHPEPHALIGTFNPSGNQPEDPDIIAQIGDQDRGHNYLVEITDTRLVRPLRDHVLLLHTQLHGPWERLLPSNNRVLQAGDTCLYLFPRLLRDVLRQELLTLPTGTTLRVAVSHMNDRRMAKTLGVLARRGMGMEILAHDTERRVPRRIEDRLGEHLVFRRYSHPEGLPMHNKFILIDTPRCRKVVFGSMNLSKSSLHANHELLGISTSPFLYEAFRGRWDQMMDEVEAMRS